MAKKGTKGVKPMSPKQQAAMRKKEQDRKLAEIKRNAYERGQRQAARYIAEREGFEAGVRSQMSKNR